MVRNMVADRPPSLLRRQAQLLAHAADHLEAAA